MNLIQRGCSKAQVTKTGRDREGVPPAFYPDQTSPDTEKEIGKLLRKPRTKLFARALKNMDIVSEQDEDLIRRMKNKNGISEQEAVTFTPQDMESFRKSIEEHVAADIQREEALRKAEEDRLDCVLLDIISPCGLPSHIVHSITREGEIRKHYTRGEVQAFNEGQKRATEIVLQTMATKDMWTYVEIYRKWLVQRAEDGTVIKIFEIPE